MEDLREIIALKRSAPERVTLLLGNHDCGYMYGGSINQCRKDYRHSDAIRRLFRENKELFQLAAETYRGGRHFVFVHAGIQPGWMDEHVPGWNVGNMVEKLNGMNAAALELEYPEESPFAGALAEADEWRGGVPGAFGSPVWADAEAMNDGYQIADVVQIVGHTAVQKADMPIITKSVIYADCRRALVLGPRGGLRYLNGRPCVKGDSDPFHPRSNPSEAYKSFDLDWFHRPFCRMCGSHNIHIRTGMMAERWHCMDCNNDQLL